MFLLFNTSNASAADHLFANLYICITLTNIRQFLQSQQEYL